MALSFPLRKQLHSLKRSGATWQLAVVPGHVDLANGDRAYVALCVQGDGKIRAISTTDHEPDLGTWERLVVEAISKPPKPLSAQRPAAIRLLDATQAVALGDSLRGLKITVEHHGDMSAIDRAVEGLTEHLGRGATGLPDSQRDLRTLAAAFTAQRPWRAASSEEGLQLTLTVPGWQQAVAVVMGSGGETYGLALYRTIDGFETTYAGRAVHQGASVESLALLLDDRVDAHSRTRRLKLEPPIFVYNPPHREPEALTQDHHARALLLAGHAVLAWVTAMAGGWDSDETFEFNGVQLRPLDPLGWDAMREPAAPSPARPLPEDAKDRAMVVRMRELREIEMFLEGSVEDASESRPGLQDALDLAREFGDELMPPNQPMWVCALPWLAHEVYDEDGSLADVMGRLSGDDDVERWVEANRRAVTSVWQVRATRPGVGVWLRDTQTDDERFVVDIDASHTMQLHTLLFARVVTIEGISALVGAHPAALQGRYREPFADHLKQLRHDAGARSQVAVDFSSLVLLLNWHQLITTAQTAFADASAQRALTNTDGDPLLFVEDSFSCEPGQHTKVRAALRSLTGAQAPEHDPDSVVFMRAAQTSALDEIVFGSARLHGKGLTLTTNSVVRADALRKLVEGKCGASIGFRARTLADPMSDANEPEAAPVQEVPPDVQQAMREMRLTWLRRWPDEALPALDGKSAREAAQIPGLRRQLVALFEGVEAMEARQEPALRLDLASLRAELGLPALPQ